MNNSEIQMQFPQPGQWDEFILTPIYQDAGGYRPPARYTQDEIPADQETAMQAEDMEKALQAASARWGNWVKYVIAAIIGAAAAAGCITVTGCGHSVNVTPNRTEVCKDGSCLVLEPGHISYSQAQPETDVPPVVQPLKK